MSKLFGVVRIRDLGNSTFASTDYTRESLLVACAHPKPISRVVWLLPRFCTGMLIVQ